MHLRQLMLHHPCPDLVQVSSRYSALCCDHRNRGDRRGFGRILRLILLCVGLPEELLFAEQARFGLP